MDADALDGVLGAATNTLLCPRCVPAFFDMRDFEEMAGSDQVPDSNDSKRAQVGKRKPSTRAKWRSYMSAYRGVAPQSVGTADIVRNGDFATIERYNAGA